MLTMIEKTVDAWFSCIPRANPNLSERKPIKLVAHRGAHNKALGYLENTHQAFAYALELGCWGIELDIHATADNVLVVNHDPTLQRLWKQSHLINELSFQQLRYLASEVPSLAEVVARYGHRLHLFLELKAPFKAQDALQHTLQALMPVRDYHLIALDETLLSSLNHFPKQSLLLVATHNNIGHFCKLSLQQQYGGVLGHYLLFNDNKIKQLTRAQQKTGVGFVNSKFSLYREARRPWTWIFSDNIVPLIPFIPPPTVARGMDLV